MTLDKALQRAASHARARNRQYFVVFESGEYDSASEYDLDTFYAGAVPLYGVQPDGTVETAN